MALKGVFNFRTLTTTFLVANGWVMYQNYNRLRKSRPEYKDVAPPEEKHRIAIFDNIASTYDTIYSIVHTKLGITGAKASMLRRSKGHVLEVAAGTLENYKLYGDIDSLTAVDSSLPMCLEMKRKIEAAKPDFPVTIIYGDACNLPFGDESFGTVVSTHTLCSVENPEACLNEIARVLKPSGRYFALERGKVYYEPLRRILEWLKIYPNPAVPWKYGHFENRDPLAIMGSCKNLKITDFAVFGYGMNYSIVARRADCEKVSEMNDKPLHKPDIKVIHEYTPGYI